MRNPDPQVLQQALDGDEQAFSIVVEVYQSPVYNLCYRMLGDGGEAEDAAQETFWRAYQAMNRYDRQRPFGTWLLSIAAHYCIDLQRKRRLATFAMDEVAEETVPDPAPIPEKVVSQHEQDHLLHQVLDSLNPQDRAVIVLRYWYEMSEEEISNTLSLTVSAVKSRLHRARLLLAQRWQSALPKTPTIERSCHESPAF